MKLVHIDKSECYHYVDEISKIFYVAQLEQEFAPYLEVEYRDNDGGKERYQFISSGTIISEFSVNEKEFLRKAIFDEVQKKHNIRNIQDEPTGTTRFYQQNKDHKINRVQPKQLVHKKNKYSNFKHQIYNFSNKKMQGGDCRQVVDKICDQDYKKNTPLNNVCKKIMFQDCQRQYGNSQQLLDQNTAVNENKIEGFGTHDTNIYIIVLTIIIIIYCLRK